MSSSEKRAHLLLLDVLIVLWLLLMAQGILTPARFRIDKSVWSMFFRLPSAWWLSRDMVENLLLAVPGGMIAGAREILRERGSLRGVLFALAVFGGAGFALEILQWWVPGRTASFWDGVAMALGALLGGMAGVMGAVLFLGRLSNWFSEERFPFLFLSGLWVLSSFIPSAFELSSSGIRESIMSFLNEGELSRGKLLLQILSWLIVARLLFPSLDGKTFRAALLLLALFGVRSFGLLVTPGRHLEREAFIGFLIFFGAWSVLRERIGLRLLTALAVLFLVFRSFPSDLAVTTSGFFWNPGFELHRLGRLGIIRVTAEEYFPLIALPVLWVQSLSRRRYLVALLSVTCLLGALEYYRVSCCVLTGSTFPAFIWLTSGFLQLLIHRRDSRKVISSSS